MGKRIEDTGQPDHEQAPDIYVRTLWGMRRRIQKYADSRGYTTNTAVVVLLDEALRRKGIQ